ncbi:hypothetical protein ACVSD9_24715 (plasmid) [Vibrio parahaemolyticus]
MRDVTNVTFDHFGAVPYKFDGVFVSSTDAFIRGAKWSKENNRTIYLHEDNVYYLPDPAEIGNATIRNTGGKRGGADPGFLRRPDGTYVFDTPNWEYYFHSTEQGRSYTWKEMITETCYGPAIISDYNGPVLTAMLGTRFDVDGFTVVGDHRQILQHGLASATPHQYVGTGQRRLSISVLGTGSHGVYLPGGLEVTKLDELHCDWCNGHGLMTGYIDGVDCATEYITFDKGSFGRNRLDGIYLSQLRKALKVTGTNLSGNGQYDSPYQEVDPLLGYDRRLPTNRRDYMAGVRVNDTTLDSVGMTGFMFGIKIEQCYGEVMAKALHVRGRNKNGVVRDISLSSNHFIRLAQLQSHVANGGDNGCVFYFDCNYLADVHSEGNYPQSLDLFDFEDVSDFQKGSFYIFDAEFVPKTEKEIAIAEGMYHGDYAYKRNLNVEGRLFANTYQSVLNIGGSAGEYRFMDIANDYRWYSPSLNTAGMVASWTLTAHWQASNNTMFGGYLLHVTKVPSGKFALIATPLGSTQGFTSPPTINPDTGEIIVNIESYYRLNLRRMDLL